MPRRILIDGYNMIRTNPSGSAVERSRGTTAARQWLIELCRRAAKSGEQWNIVFDGDGTPEYLELHAAQLAVRYAAPETADALLRGMAQDAVAGGNQCMLVSSDNEVRVDGCAFQTSDLFYDYLLRQSRPAAERKLASEEFIEKLLAYLAECGHIKRGIFLSAALQDALGELLTYFAAEPVRPQKIARAVESLLRDGIKLVPEPDAEKLVYRNLKIFFEKHTG